jgi:hypothetical protein
VPDQDCPREEHGQASSRQVFQNDDRFVVRVVPDGLRGPVKAAVIVVAFRTEMVNGDLGIVQQTPPRLLDAKREPHVIVQLRTRTEKPPVEPNVAYRAHPITHVRPFEDIDVPGWAHASMVVTDVPPEPLDLADYGMIPISMAVVQIVTSTHAAERCIRGEMPRDTFQPLGPRPRVVIRDGNDLALDAIQAGVQRSHLTGYIYHHDLQG